MHPTKPPSEPPQTPNRPKPSGWTAIIGELLVQIAICLPFGIIGSSAYLAYAVGGFGLLLLLLPLWVGLFYALRRTYGSLLKKYCKNRKDK